MLGLTALREADVKRWASNLQWLGKPTADSNQPKKRFLTTKYSKYAKKDRINRSGKLAFTALLLAPSSHPGRR